ncbi:MAG: TVP38/TMEM64 family protein [Spirochaetae bacterium HGW-Spirochaetae-7]|nr:MAG: TVP38/TMEM64 family protein [Spirochaetae bacterium HGW-Spirochaetae-7]
MQRARRIFHRMLGARARRLAAIVGFPLLLCLVAATALAFRSELFGLFRSAESIRARVSSSGPFAPLVFVGLQVIQVVIFVIPGEVVQVAGGFAFGMWGGTLWSAVGILAGSLVNFGIGRLLGRPFVEAVFGAERTARMDSATAGGKAAAGFFLLFAIPGIPKDALTYAAGASRLSFASFILVSTLGRLPGIVGSAYMGSAVFDREYRGAITVMVLSSALFLLGLFFRKAIHDWVARVISKTCGRER